jgi:hypothetical protein
MGDGDRPLCDSASLKEVVSILSDVKVTVAVIRNETEWLKGESGEAKEKTRRIWAALDALDLKLQCAIKDLSGRIGALENQQSSWRGGLQTLLLVINAILMSGLLVWFLTRT